MHGMTITPFELCVLRRVGKGRGDPKHFRSPYRSRVRAIIKILIDANLIVKLGQKWVLTDDGRRYVVFEEWAKSLPITELPRAVLVELASWEEHRLAVWSAYGPSTGDMLKLVGVARKYFVAESLRVVGGEKSA